MYSYGVPNGPVIKHTLRCFWQALEKMESSPFLSHSLGLK